MRAREEMHMRAVTIAAAASLLFGFAAGPALAQGQVALKAVAEQEVREVNADGEEIVKRVLASKVVPGGQVIYTITATSLADEPVENIQIEDPIPEHMTYVMNSVEGGDAAVTFSVDGGKTFAAGDGLSVADASGARRPAKAADYTHVRWLFAEPLAARGTRSVSFRAQLN
jgi:uncharacterized repeat protein (TIGR01451 family)